MRAADKRGFSKNPLSLFFHHRKAHLITRKSGEAYLHEVQRNLSLVDETSTLAVRPQLFPSAADEAIVQDITGNQPYYVVAPASVWFTKQYPAAKWIPLVQQLANRFPVYLIGAQQDHAHAELIRQQQPEAINLCGKLSMMQSVALIKHALRTFSNDSAPLHFASAVNAPVTASFCSTIPEFGFGPLSEAAQVVQLETPLYCRPCGLHGYRQCPEKHFRCALEIDDHQVYPPVQMAEDTMNKLGEDFCVRDAASVLAHGGVIIHQTDTVPGFAVAATQPDAINRLRNIKGRDAAHSFLLLCNDEEMLRSYTDQPPAYLQLLLDISRQIPLTVVYRSAAILPKALAREDGTIAIRLVQHPQTQALISSLGQPIVSTSVNETGQPPAGSLRQVPRKLQFAVDRILHHSESRGAAVSSTIVSVAGNKPVLIRKGATCQALEDFLVNY
jgi:tRNA threonylcarbamoyl adenosine modification protein (Sua5/YciO/YrdC/YwlC family)